MRVLLIRPNSKMRTTFLPLGMGYIADAVRKAGHEVSILDARRERLSSSAVVDAVKKINPAVIGLSAMHFEKHGLKAVAKDIKGAGISTPLVLGGPLVSTSGAELVQEGIVDIAVVGEGELKFNQYIESLEGKGGLEAIPGMIFRHNGEIILNDPGPFIENLDEGMLAWDLIEPDRYYTRFGRATQNTLARSYKRASIFTSRGCPFGCIYCHNVFGKKFRSRSPESVLGEISLLVKEYGIEELEIVDDCFNLDLDRAKKIAKGIRDLNYGLHIVFSNGLRADRMDEELIDLLKEAGTYRINYAVETASPRLQKFVRKNLDLDRTQDVIAYTASRGIFTFGYFMMGFPTETEDEMRMTIDYAIRSKFHAASFFYVNPFPGTELARQFPVDISISDNINHMDYSDLKVNLSEVSDEKLRQLRKEAYRKLHFAPDRVWRTFRVVPKNHRTVWAVGITGLLAIRDIGNW